MVNLHFVAFFVSLIFAADGQNENLVLKNLNGWREQLGLTPELIKPSHLRFINNVSPQNIKRYLQNSIASSCPSGKIGTTQCLCKATYEGTRIIEDENTAGLAVVTINKKYKQIVVSYRATHNIQNLITDINFRLVNVDFAPRNVKVHLGFYQHYKALKTGTHKAVVEKLSNPRYKNYTLHITGYSLGAAVSTISAMDWYKLLKRRGDNRPFEVYSFSNPRAGNQAFVDFLAKHRIPLARFITSNDYVPHTPPRYYDYIHAGLEFYYDPNTDQVRTCSNAYYEDPSCGNKNTILAFPPHLSPFDKPLPSLPFC